MDTGSRETHLCKDDLGDACLYEQLCTLVARVHGHVQTLQVCLVSAGARAEYADKQCKPHAQRRVAWQHSC